MDNGIRKVVIYEQYGILAKTTILTVFKRQKKYEKMLELQSL